MTEEHDDKYGSHDKVEVKWNAEAWDNRNPDDHSVIAVMAGCLVYEHNAEYVLAEFASNLGAKHPILIIGTATTLPDVEEQDHPVPESGGRKDFFFCFHNLDIMRVAIPRLAYGVRWWEDVVDNEWNNLPLSMKADYRENSIYPDYVFDTLGFGSGVYAED